jgi:hypothetical protein
VNTNDFAIILWILNISRQNGDEALRWLARWGQRELAWSLKVFTLHQTAPSPVLRPAPAGLLMPARLVAPPRGAL